MCSCSQVELVGVVLEHQQSVEVPPPFQDSVLVGPPARRRVGEAVHRQRRPGSLAGLLQVAPGQVKTRVRVGDTRTRGGGGGADLICWMRRWRWWGSSRPQTETLRAPLSVVQGSGQVSEDRK